MRKNKPTVDSYPHESFIQKSVIKYLTEKGWYVCEEKELWEHGVDIKVRNIKYSRYGYVEVKGGSQAKSKRAVETNNFVFGLGQIVTRIQTKTNPRADKGGPKYGVAYPDYFVKYLQSGRIHWNLCRNLNLYIFLVKSNGEVEEYDWTRIEKEFY